MRHRNDGLQVATELALLGVTAAAIIGMHRLFEDGSFRGPLLLQALLAHVTMAALRRARVRLLPAAVAAVVIGALCITWAQYLRTTWMLIPSPDTLTAIRADMDGAWAVFQEVQAPAPVEPGFIVATSLAVWVIAFVADWGAFRTGVSFEALLPPATLFLFAAVLGADGARTAAAALFVAAAMLFLLLHRTWRQEDTATWAALHHHRGRRALVTSGGSLACVAVLAGALVGPNLPGAENSALLPWRELTDDQEPRVVISPLVDIQSRLLQQPNVNVFTVRTDNPDGAYWRLTALDSFTGSIWKSSYKTDDVDNELPRSNEHAADTTLTTQTITIQALAAIWLPAAYEPISLDSDAEVDYDEDSATLIVDRDADTSDGLQYTVTSRVSDWTGEELQTASDEVPDDIADRYLQLPDDFSDRIRNEAEGVVVGAEGPYAKAMALQAYLRGDPFEYSTQVQHGHSNDVMEDFLFVTHKGYCEQFAGTYAAMARAIGLPSRVVVGFTKGTRDDSVPPDEPALFRVNGEHAHAWVELWFDGFGWVTFDPTPGRAPPNAQDWLNVPEQQDETGGGGETATTVPPNQGQPGGPAPTRPSGPIQDDRAVTADAPDAATTPRDDGGNPILEPLKRAAGPAGLVGLAYLLLVPLALALKTSLRRRRARAPVDRVGLAWIETNERLALAGLHMPASLTIAERAARMRLAFPATAPSIELLSGSIERVTYGEVEPTKEEAARATAASAEIGAAAARRQPWYRRVLPHLDIRRLVPEPDRARRTTHGAQRTHAPASGSGSGSSGSIASVKPGR
jgi:transglutaminase-like putative cysteine protease